MSKPCSVSAAMKRIPSVAATADAMVRASVGMDLRGPSPDFAQLARSISCYGEGPIEDPRELGGALRRAIAEVKAGKLALLDTVTQFR